jgi:hypothetical protein
VAYAELALLTRTDTEALREALLATPKAVDWRRDRAILKGSLNVGVLGCILPETRRSLTHR